MRVGAKTCGCNRNLHARWRRAGGILFGEERIEKFVPPDAGRAIKRGTEVGFAPEPKLFRDAPRGNVFGLAGGDYAMGLERIEHMSEKRLACFGRIALLPVGLADPVAELQPAVGGVETGAGYLEVDTSRPK